jgi:hypothetical protein
VLEHRTGSQDDGFSVFYSDPSETLTDEYHHLDIHVFSNHRTVKVFSARWIQPGEPDVITFKRGEWEERLLS